MRSFLPSLAAVALLSTAAGCMCRPGVVDCTTTRTYPAFCKPLCGGPLDPFVWVTGDCNTCCCGSMCGAYTPYGGRTCHGDQITFEPSCSAPPLRYAPPAVPVVSPYAQPAQPDRARSTPLRSPVPPMPGSAPNSDVLPVPQALPAETAPPYDPAPQF